MKVLGLFKPGTQGSQRCSPFPPRWYHCRRTAGFSRLLVSRWDSAWLCTGTGTAPGERQQNRYYPITSFRSAPSKTWTTHWEEPSPMWDVYLTDKKPYDVAEDSWSHEICQFGHLENVERTFGLQLVSQRQQSAEGSCCGSAHTTGKTDIVLLFFCKTLNSSCWPARGRLTHCGPQWVRPWKRSPPSPGWRAQRRCWWDCRGLASGGRGSVWPPARNRPVGERVWVFPTVK